MKIWLSAVLMIWTMGSASAADLRVVTLEQLDYYWEIAPERMVGALPPSARGTHAILERYGEVRLDYEVTIDREGVPRDFLFKSITPRAADPRPFIAMEQFFRYRPAASNPTASAVRLTASKRNFTPKSQRKVR